MSYRTDIFGYVLLKTSTSAQFNADPSDPDSLLTLQAAINSDYRTVFIGNAGETYTISQPLYGKENKTYVINCEIKIKDGSIVDLTHNFTISTNTLELTSASTYFAEGEHVSISDDNRAVQGGGTGQTRREGRSFIITDITGDVITFDGITPITFTTAANAKIGHTQSPLIFDNTDNIKIMGSGTLNGNKANQYDIEPVFTSVYTGENDMMGCGLVLYNLDNAIVNDIEIKDCLLHCIAMNYLNDITIDNVTVTGAHDKGILIRHTYDSTISNCSITDSDYEDGITMYDTVERMLIDSCTITDCGRSGIIDNDHNEDCIIKDCNINTYGYAYSLMNKTTTFQGTNTFSSTGQYRHAFANRQVFRVYLLKDYVQDLAGVIITGGANASYGLHISSCENVEVQNATVHGINSPVIAAFASSLVATTAKFTNLTLYDNDIDYGHDVNTTLTIE